MSTPRGPQSTSRPSLAITLIQATEANLPALVDVQFECFNHSVLIEKITKPDTPAARAAMVESHRQALREDKGMRIVKAVVPSSEAGHETIPSPTKHGSYILPLPLRAMFDEDPASAAVNARDIEVAPSMQIPASATSELSTSTDSTLALGDPSAMPAAASNESNGNETEIPGSAQIQISQTNVPTLLSGRKRTLNKLVVQRARYATDWPPPIGYVRYMCVSPSFRRHGIGARLMDWGCQRFDEQGFDAYLQATAEGEPMYARFGFTVVGEQVLKVYGVEGVEGERYANMWRDVQPGSIQESH